MQQSQKKKTEQLARERFLFFFAKIIILGGFVFSLFFLPKAQAVQVKKVQSGIVEFSAEDIARIVSIREVDTSKTIILISVETGSTHDYGSFFVPEFYDSKTIYISRSKKEKPAKIGWTIIEFADGVFVQRGNSDVPEGILERVTSIPQSVSPAKSFIITYPKSSNRLMSRSERTTATVVFDSNNEIKFSRRSKKETVTIGWQVVEFETDASVQSGILRLSTGQTTKEVNLQYPIDVEKSFLILTSSGSEYAGGLGEQYYVRGEIEANTKLKFSRNSAVNDVVTSWFLVSLHDGSRVQRGLQSVTTKSEWIDIEEVDLDRSCVLGSVSGDISFDNLNTYFIRTELKNNNIVLRRYLPSQAHMAWYLIEFTPFNLAYPNGEEILEVGDEVEISWTTSSSSNLENFKLEWSADNGRVWHRCVGPPPSNNRGDSVNPQEKTFDWIIPRVPAEVDTDCMFRITNTKTGFTDYVDLSNGNFTIKSKLELDFPNGQEIWDVASAQDIRWRYWGNFSPQPRVVLEYSTDYPDYNEWVNIDTVAHNLNEDEKGLCHYLWENIPLQASSPKVKIRVKSSNNPKIIHDASDIFFTIKENISITKPGSKQQWPAGYKRDIEWKLNCKISPVTKVNIYYSLDKGLEWKTIVTNQDADNLRDYTRSSGEGFYSWVPPLSDYSKETRLKIVLAEDKTVFGSVGFEITPPITINQPKGGDTVRVFQNDANSSIDWVLGEGTTIDRVRISYCTDFSGVKTWQEMTSPKGYDTSVGGPSFSRPWSVPDDISADCGIRIEDFSDDTIYDESDAGFKIKGWIDIHQPFENAVINASRSFWIKWTNKGTLTGNYAIKYSGNNGADDFPTMIATTAQGDFLITDQEYKWVLPDTTNLNEADSKIKIEKIGDGDVTVGLSGNFTIVGNIAKVKVQGADRAIYHPGDICTITWDAYPAVQGLLGMVEIAYDLYGGNGADGIANSRDEYQDVIGTTDAYYNPVYGVEIYTWQIPIDTLLSDQVRFQVRSLGFPEKVHAETLADSAIYGTIALSRPSSNAAAQPLIWQCGTTESIQWFWQGDSIGPVNLYYSNDAGADGFAQVIDNSGTIDVIEGRPGYQWTIPDAVPPDKASVFNPRNKGLNKEIIVKLVSAKVPAHIFSISQQPLTIKSRLTDFTSDSRMLHIGAKDYSINWRTKGDVGTVNIKYDIVRGSGGYIGTIVSNLSNVDGYLWAEVNCPLSNQVRIKVESSDYPEDIYVESLNLAVKGLLEITAPDVTDRKHEALIATAQFRIKWVVNGGIGKTGVYDLGDLNLYYSADGVSWGVPFARLASSGNSFYDWTIPDNFSTSTNRLKIEDADEALDVNDVSDAFDIKGMLYAGIGKADINHVLEEPQGGEVYHIGGDDIDIQWRYKGNIGACRIYYDTNEGKDNYPHHIVSVPYNHNEGKDGLCHYSWSVPKAPGIKYRVKIYQDHPIDKEYVYAASSGNFAVKSKITLNSPGQAGIGNRVSNTKK